MVSGDGGGYTESIREFGQSVGRQGGLWRTPVGDLGRGLGSPEGVMAGRVAHETYQVA